MNRRILDKNSDGATLARIEKEMAAPRMTKSVRDGLAKHNATQNLRQSSQKKRRALPRSE